ncbi:MAG: hypothetical protein K2Q22_12165, partial [Cytophagales bacterium]|nr:hypothetical protein [Cytophagales bacterium]
MKRGLHFGLGQYVIFPILILVFFHSMIQAQMIVGYYPNYRTASFANSVPYAKMTHLHYFSLNPTRTSWGNTDGSLWVGDPYSWFTQATFNAVTTAAKAANPSIRIILCTGGATGSDGDLNIRLEQIGSTPALREKFCNNIVAFLLANNLDGWDLDWEYPNTTSARTAHQNLLARMRQKFDSVNTAMCKTWSISIAVGGGNTDRTCFNPSHMDYCNAAVINSLDYVGIMTYDGQTPASSCGYTSHTDYNLLVKGLTDWVADKGWPKSKLLGGVGFYDNWGTAFNSGGNNSTYYNQTYWGNNGVGNPVNASKLSYLKNNGYAGVIVWEVTQDNQCSGTVPACYSLLDGMTQWKNSNNWIYTPPVCTSGAPVANFTVNSVTGCLNTALTFTDASTNSPTSRLWQFGANASIATATTAGPINVSYSTSGVKTITLTATNLSGSNTIIKTVTILGVPSPLGGVYGPSPICANTTANFTFLTGPNINFYSWTVPPGSIIQSGSTTSIINLLAGSSGGNVMVTYGNACSSSFSFTPLSIINTPTIPGIITGNSTICPSSSNTYSISTVSGALAYQWTIPSGWTGNSTTSSINTLSNSSSGTISVRAVNSCGSSSIRSLGVSVTGSLPQPVSITGVNAICPNSINVYSIPTISGANSYSWSLPSGWSGSSVTNMITITSNNLGGTISVSAVNSCTTSSSQNLAISITTGAGNAGSIVGPSNVCTGSTGNVYAISPVVGASSYSWNVPMGSIITSGTNSNSITLTAGSNSGLIIVTPISPCGNGNSSSLTLNIVTVPGSPTSILGSSSLCEGTSVTYSIGTVAGANSYSWTLPSGWTGISTTTSILVNASSISGTIGVRAVSAVCGNGSLQNLGVTVVPLPLTPSPISGSTNICPFSTNTYSVSSVSGVSYVWNLPSGWSGNSTSSSIVLTSNALGGNLSVRSINSCGTSTSTNLAIAVNGGLPVSGSIQCGSGVANLQVLTSGGPYLWYLSSVGGSSIFSGNPFTPTISATSVFYVDQSSITNGQVGMTTKPATDVQVYDNILAQRVFPSSSNTMLFNTSINNVTINSVDIWTGTQSQMNLANFWVTIENNASTVLFTSPKYSILSSFPTANPKFKTVPLGVLLTTAGTYKMRIWCDPQADAWGIVATGQPLPVSDVSNTVTLSSGYDVFTNVQFQYGSGSGSCGRTPVTASVTSAFVPSVSILSTTTTICSGNNVIFNATPVFGGASPSYQWKNNGVNIPGATGSSFSISSLSGGNFISVVMTSSASCTSISTATSNGISIQINASPSAPSSISGLNSVCSGASATYSISTVSGASSYAWTVPSGATILSGQGTNSIILTHGTTSGTVAVRAINSCGTSTSSNLSVNVNSSPAAAGAITGASSVCANQTGVLYSITTILGATSYNWTLPNGASIVSGAGTNAISVNFGSNPGVLSVSPINTCGTGSGNNLTISINPPLTPSVSISSSATSVCSGTTVTFTATGTNGGTAPSYQWLRNGAPQSTGMTYSYTPSNGDVISAIQTAGGTLPTCLSGTTATSTGI